MIFACLHCKTDVAAEVLDRALVGCPECDFLFVCDPAGRREVPTYAEESTLPRIEGKRAEPAMAGRAPDATLIGDTTDAFGSLPLPPGKSLYLEVLEGGPGSGIVIPFHKGRMVIGRTDADITFDDERISRKHALIEAISRENIYLKDLASTNGTFLNGHRVTMKKLREGDEIRIGSVCLRFVVADA
jgi:hypothetical protein